MEVEKEEACASPNTAAVASACAAGEAVVGVREGGGVRRRTLEMDKVEAPRQIRPPWLSPDLKKAASAGVGEDGGVRRPPPEMEKGWRRGASGQATNELGRNTFFFSRSGQNV